MDDLVNYMGYEWISVDDGILTFGINEEGLEEFSEITSVSLPTVGEEIFPDEVCGEIETDQGPLNLYCPIDGVVSEINEAAQENPSVIIEDCFGDGWLFKVEANNIEDTQNLNFSGDRDAEDFS